MSANTATIQICKQPGEEVAMSEKQAVYEVNGVRLNGDMEGKCDAGELQSHMHWHTHWSEDGKKLASHQHSHQHERIWQSHFNGEKDIVHAHRHVFRNGDVSESVVDVNSHVVEVDALPHRERIGEWWRSKTTASAPYKRYVAPIKGDGEQSAAVDLTTPDAVKSEIERMQEKIESLQATHAELVEERKERVRAAFDAFVSETADAEGLTKRKIVDLLRDDKSIFDAFMPFDWILDEASPSGASDKTPADSVLQ